jgi:hypothetical protein
MEKKNFSKCKFYRGEAKCPFSDRSSTFFWFCERDWCSRSDFSREIKALKRSGQDELAVDEFGNERFPLSLAAVIYSSAKPGWDFLEIMRMYTDLDKAGSYALVEKIPTSVVTRNGVTSEVEDDSWWQDFLASHAKA